MSRKARGNSAVYLTGRRKPFDEAPAERKEAILYDLPDHFSMHILRKDAPVY